MHVCGNNYTAPHQSVTSSAIITKKIIQNTIIAVLNLHTFRHNKMGSSSMYDLHDRILHRTQNALWSSSTSIRFEETRTALRCIYTQLIISCSFISIHQWNLSSAIWCLLWNSTCTFHRYVHCSLNVQIDLSSIRALECGTELRALFGLTAWLWLSVIYHTTLMFAHCGMPLHVCGVVVFTLYSKREINVSLLVQVNEKDF